MSQLRRIERLEEILYSSSRVPELPRVSLREALTNPNLLGNALVGESWRGWRVLLLAAMGEKLSPDELEIFRSLTDRETSPSERVQEAWFVIGRRGGKSRAISVLCAYLAGLCRYNLAPGETGIVLCLSSSEWQAKVAFNYTVANFTASPVLRQLIVRQTSEVLELSNGISIEIRSASYRRLRGPTVVAAVLDEIAFWYSEDSANPDTEVLRALRPSLMTTRGMLFAISSPYARRGELWESYRRDFGPSGNPSVLVARGASKLLNPELPQDWIDREYERDPASATAEYGAVFRTDVETFVRQEVVEACTDIGVPERPPIDKLAYCAFADPSGGSADSFTLAIAHIEEGITVLDAVREIAPPFSPADTVLEMCKLLKAYRITRCFGDRYAVAWVIEQFALNGVTFVSEGTPVKSALYGSLLPMLNSRTVALLDHERLRMQLLQLERKTGRGRDVVDHPRGGHDDVANAVAGALVLARHEPMAASVAGFNRKIEYPKEGSV